MNGMKKEKKVPTTERKQRVFLEPSDEIEDHLTRPECPESLLWMNELWEMFPSDNHRRGKDQGMKAKPKAEEEDLEETTKKDSLAPALEGLAIGGAASKVAAGVDGKDGEGTTTPTPAPLLDTAGLKLGALDDTHPDGQATSSQPRTDENATSMQILAAVRYSVTSLSLRHPCAINELQAVHVSLDLAEKRLIEESLIDENATSMEILETTRYSIISLGHNHPSAKDESQAMRRPLDLAEKRLIEESIGKE